MKFKAIYGFGLAALLSVSCGQEQQTTKDVEVNDTASVKVETTFNYQVDQFADIKILRYQIPGFEDLTLKEQKLVYYMTQAGLAGRDMMWAQNYRHNLTIREALEKVYTSYSGDKSSANWKSFDEYLKRVWFANGIHHHYSNAKLKPEFSADYLRELLTASGATLEGEAFDVIFNDKDAKKVNLSKDADIVLESAINFYGPDVTTADVEAYYGAIKVDKNEPIEVGLNTRLVKENGKLVEQVYKSGGMYGAAIDQVISWLEKAKGVAENPEQGEALRLLIEYYKTGSLDTWDDYCIAWATSTKGNIDWINGF